jgi:hypothetical protein
MMIMIETAGTRRQCIADTSGKHVKKLSAG